MSGAPSVTVVMPVRDPDPRHLQSAVGSLLAQDAPSFELIVVEDAGARPPQDDRPVRPVDLSFTDDARIRHVVNAVAGIAAARNRGIEEARAPRIAMLDADDTCAVDRLRRQSECFADDPELTVLGTQLRIIDENDGEQGSRIYPIGHDEILRALPVFNPIAQPSVMFDKAAAQAVGGYRDRTCEDYDLWSRMALAGARFANINEQLVSYRLHSGSMKSRKLRASLRDTIDIKREHWSGQFGMRGRVRLVCERALLLLPPRLVFALFKRISLATGA